MLSWVMVAVDGVGTFSLQKRKEYVFKHHKINKWNLNLMRTITPDD